MQSIIDKYEAILKKPLPEPFKGYIEELLTAVKGNETTVTILNKPKSQKIKLLDAAGFMPAENISL